MTKPYVVGISGGSASGKTFLLEQLFSQLPDDRLTLISQDNYYKPLKEQKRDEDGLVNFDHPESVNLEGMMRDLKKLVQGKSFSLEEYTFNNPRVKPRILEFHPAPVLVLEGLFIYHLPELNKMYDLKIFVEADEHIKLVRRLRRDHTERGYTVDSILRDYEKFVAPMFHRYVAPLKHDCDLIIPNNKHMYKAIHVLVNHLRQVLNERRQP